MMTFLAEKSDTVKDNPPYTVLLIMHTVLSSKFQKYVINTVDKVPGIGFFLRNLLSLAIVSGMEQNNGIAESDLANIEDIKSLESSTGSGRVVRYPSTWVSVSVSNLGANHNLRIHKKMEINKNRTFQVYQLTSMVFFLLLPWKTTFVISCLLPLKQKPFRNGVYSSRL